MLEHEHMGVSPFEPDDVRPERKINVKTEDDREGTAASKLDKEKHSRESADSATSPNDSLGNLFPPNNFNVVLGMQR